MITYRLALHQCQPQRARELVQAIQRNPGCCDTVWLTTMGYYPPMEKHVGYAEGWLESAQIFREAGLEVSLQIANTIGHCDQEQINPKHKDIFAQGMLPPESPPPYLVGPDGKSNHSCFCFRSRQFREYINQMLKTYVSRLKPTRLWFDDDLRVHHHNPNMYNCFCQRCVQEFNRENNSDFSREELVDRINYRDLALRKKYLEFLRKGMYDFVLGAAKACLEVAPDTLFGLEYEHMHNYLGKDDEHILGALFASNGKEIHTRPGALHYNDKAPWGQYAKTVVISAANSTLPSYVTRSEAEIEDLPGVAFGKSIGGILNEGTLDLAVGCTGLTFTDVQSCHEPMSYYEKIFAGIARMRPYWERLSHLSQTAYRAGLSIYWGEAPQLRPLQEGDAPFLWDKMLYEADTSLLRLGVPLTYDSRGDFAYLIHHSTVDALSDKDIAFLLTKPVITDGESVDKLIRRGFGSYFPFTAKAIENNTEEFFTDNPITGDQSALFYSENPIASRPMKRFVFENTDERTTVLGNAYNNCFLSDGAFLGPCSVVTGICHPRGNKAKWAIFGYSIWSDIVSSAKRNQILGALDAIAPMPARILSDDPAVLYVSVSPEGKTLAATVSAASQNGAEHLKLSLRNPKGKNLCLFSTKRPDPPFTAEETEHGLLVTLPYLEAYETVTVFLG